MISGRRKGRKEKLTRRRVHRPKNSLRSDASPRRVTIKSLFSTIQTFFQTVSFSRKHISKNTGITKEYESRYVHVPGFQLCSSFFSFFVSVPTKPLNLSSHGITSTTIELSWAEPDYANGIISGYRIYYMHSNYTDVQMYRTDEYDGPIIEFVLKELGEYSHSSKRRAG